MKLVRFKSYTNGSILYINPEMVAAVDQYYQEEDVSGIHTNGTSFAVHGNVENVIQRLNAHRSPHYAGNV